MSESIPAGFYKGRAVANSAQYGEKNGNEYICLDLNIPTLNRTLTTFLYFSDAATPYAIQRLRACGWTGEDISNLDGVDRNEVDVQIKYEMYKNELKMKVDIATGGGTFKIEDPLDDKRKRAFAARLRGQLKGGAAPVIPPKAAPRNGNVTQEDDEIPF